MQPYFDIDAETLRRLYLEDRLPMTEVAQTPRMLVGHRRPSPETARHRVTTQGHDSSASNDIGTAERLVGGSRVGDRAHRDGREPFSRRSASRGSIQRPRPARDTSAMPRVDQ